jgi:hypothetical protein
MFCPFCGFEYTQKLNYCKRCGENLNPGVPPVEVKAPRLNIAALATAVTVFGLGGLVVVFTAYYQLIRWGLRGDDALVPFIGSLVFISGVSGLLLYQLSRVITAMQQTRHIVYSERPVLPESRQAAYASPTEARRSAIEIASVTESTTRQFGAAHEPVGHE